MIQQYDQTIKGHLPPDKYHESQQLARYSFPHNESDMRNVLLDPQSNINVYDYGVKNELEMIHSDLRTLNKNPELQLENVHWWRMALRIRKLKDLNIMNKLKYLDTYTRKQRKQIMRIWERL